MENALGLFLGLSVLFVFYFLPTIVAMQRNHSNDGAILFVNLFLGWTFLGWVVALAWSATDNVRTPKQNERRPNQNELQPCPLCGGRLNGQHHFCQHCGTELDWTLGRPLTPEMLELTRKRLVAEKNPQPAKFDEWGNPLDTAESTSDRCASGVSGCEVS